jgi:hypothetical protein
VEWFSCVRKNSFSRIPVLFFYVEKTHIHLRLRFAAKEVQKASSEHLDQLYRRAGMSFLPT